MAVSYELPKPFPRWHRKSCGRKRPRRRTRARDQAGSPFCPQKIDIPWMSKKNLQITPFSHLPRQNARINSLPHPWLYRVRPPDDIGQLAFHVVVEVHQVIVGKEGHMGQDKKTGTEQPPCWLCNPFHPERIRPGQLLSLYLIRYFPQFRPISTRIRDKREKAYA
jgi:hypothetical protein